MTAATGIQRIPSTEIPGTVSHSAGIDGELVTRCKEGDASAFDLLYHRHAARLYRICCSLLGGERDAEDAVQVVFTRAFQSLHKFNGRSSFSTWLYAVAVGEVKNIRRSRRRRSRLEQAYESHATNLINSLSPRAPDPEQAMLAKSMLAEIDEVFDRLPKRKRIPFLLYHGAGLKLSEIAEVMGSSVQTTSARIKSAQRELVKKMPASLLERSQGPERGAEGDR